ncbi:MAG: hypothetical protein HGA97_10470 [Chlorobiaceae bacterium]|nr:hypothetical protein [Chlorobiaceae bacterium]
MHVKKLFARESGDPVSPLPGGKRKQGGIDRRREPEESMLITNRESDGGVVPKKQPNKANPEALEDVEGKPSAKRNIEESVTGRTQRRKPMSCRLDSVRRRAG